MRLMGHLISKSNSKMTVILALITIITSLNLVTAQIITTPCTTAMINTITPCANFITGSFNNGLTPSATCCASLLSLISNSVDCACLLISANIVPFQIPLNRVLVLFLPQACNVPQMPALCKASASPLPAPGPALLGSNDQIPPPIADSPLSPQVSKSIFEVEAPKSEIDLQPALAPASVEFTPMKQKHPRKVQELD